MTNYRTLPFELKPAGGPFDDPALLVTPTNWELSFLFDSGTLHGLKTRDLQKVRWLFLSHLHIDHLIGFDHLLRVRLFSSTPLTVYGPPGTLAVIAHRLQGYAWNLTSGSPFVIRVFELSEHAPAAQEFACHHQFQPQPIAPACGAETPNPEGTIALTDHLKIRSQPVDHGVPCLTYRVDRVTAPKFSLEVAQRLGLATGPWVRDLIEGRAVSQIVAGLPRDRAWLTETLLSPPIRHSLGYLTDTKLDEPLVRRLTEFFHDIDLLCCETAYLESERELATQNLHMTTHQAADLAVRCGAQELGIFHLSRRHCQAGPWQHLLEVQQVHPRAHLLAEPSASRAASETPS